MVRVGLSGGIGSGKSTVGKILAALGAEVIDSDQVARQILSPGTEGERAVLDRFGDGVKARDGSVDRSALAAIVFAEPAARLALEAITHTLIRQEVLKRMAQIGRGVVVVELPLLDQDRRRQYGFDVVVLVDTPQDVAVRRAVSRGMSEDDVRARMGAQPTNEERLAVADRVLTNAGDLTELDARVNELWLWLEANEPRAR